jgi:PKD repeat protein
MKKTKFNLLAQAALLLVAFSILTMSSCKKDDDPDPEKPIASFQFAISPTNFLEVIFTNFSQNATSYSWNFGDGNTSTEQNPTHVYAEDGKYNVVLTASNVAGATANFAQEIEVKDPDVALALLAGQTSKTWKLFRIDASLGVGPSLDSPYDWFSLENDGSRPCKYFHEFTFTRNMEYIFDDKGFFWGEGGVFHPDLVGECLEAIPSNMVGPNGENLSAWLSGTHQFEYVPATNTVTLIGEGAWIGLPKVATNGEVTTPQNSVSFQIEITQHDGYDHMFVKFVYEWGVWVFNYASYSNASLEPEVVSFFVDFSFSVDDFTVTFENQSKDAISYSWDFGDGNTSTEVNPTHTYAEEGIYVVVLTGTGTTGDTKEAIKNISISLDPTELPPAPTEPAENVISIYSDAYTDITGVNLNPNWGQATVTSEIEIDGEWVIKMAGLNYQGIDFAGNPQNVSSKTKLHLDVYCTVATDINISVISPGAENPVTITTEAGVWKSFDILLSEYTVPDLTAVIQLKFDDAGTGASPTIFVDNIYFY